MSRVPIYPYVSCWIGLRACQLISVLASAVEASAEEPFDFESYYGGNTSTYSIVFGEFVAGFGKSQNKSPHCNTVIRFVLDVLFVIGVLLGYFSFVGCLGPGRPIFPKEFPINSPEMHRKGR